MSSPKEYIVHPIEMHNQEIRFQIYLDGKIVIHKLFNTTQECWNYVDRIENPVEDILANLGYKEVSRIR